MTGELKPYQAYKKSEENWLGSIPITWDLLKTKYLFKERVEKGYPNEPLLAATQTKGVVPKTLYENRTVIAQKDLHLLKLVLPGDFVISLRSFQGGIEKAYYKGIISPAYTIMIPSARIFDGYFKYLAKSKPFVKLLTTCVTGIREGQNIDYSILKNSKLPVPAYGDQQKIARYLDWKTSQINRFIKAKKRLIELLKEQKQVIINDAVTGKIDVRTGKPYPKYKDSGVEWVKTVPEDWSVYRLKDCSTVVLGKMLKTVPEDGFYLKKYLRTVNIQWLRPSLNDVAEMYFSQKESNIFKVQKDDILICEGGESGRCCIWQDEIEECYIQNSVHKVTCQKVLNPWFLLFQFKTIVETGYINSIVDRVSIAHLTREKLVIVPLALPSIEMQNFLIEYIREKTKRIDDLIFNLENEIKKTQEFKNVLISYVVTGKVDVRNININTKDASDAIDEGVEEEAEINEIPESETEPENDEQ